MATHSIRFSFYTDDTYASCTDDCASYGAALVSAADMIAGERLNGLGIDAIFFDARHETRDREGVTVSDATADVTALLAFRRSVGGRV